MGPCSLVPSRIRGRCRKHRLFPVSWGLDPVGTSICVLPNSNPPQNLSRRNRCHLVDCCVSQTFNGGLKHSHDGSELNTPTREMRNDLSFIPIEHHPITKCQLHLPLSSQSTIRFGLQPNNSRSITMTNLRLRSSVKTTCSPSLVRVLNLIVRPLGRQSVNQLSNFLFYFPLFNRTQHRCDYFKQNEWYSTSLDASPIHKVPNP